MKQLLKWLPITGIWYFFTHVKEFSATEALLHGVYTGAYLCIILIYFI